MVTALNVANNILGRAFDERNKISPMKLQKMIYFTYKRFFQKTGVPLFAERFEVWRYGPVLPTVYNEFKKYRDKPIKSLCYDRDGKAWSVDEGSSTEVHEAFEFVWTTYKKGNGIELSTLTHQPNTAWFRAYKRSDKFLDDDEIGAEEWLLL